MKPFQFSVRTVMGVTATFCIGMALSVQATMGVRLMFLLGFSFLWLSVLFLAYACDQRQWNLRNLTLLLFGQTLCLISLSVTLTSLGLMLKAMFGPILMIQ